MASRLIESITVIDSAGNERTVERRANQVAHRPLTGSAQALDGSQRFFVDGQSVNELPDGTFQVVQTDEVLRRA